MKKIAAIFFLVFLYTGTSYAADLVQKPNQRGYPLGNGVIGIGGRNCDPRKEDCGPTSGCDPQKQTCTPLVTGCDPAIQTCTPFDLGIKKTGGTTPAPVGWYAFTIAISNPGLPFTAPPGSLVITDTVPAGMSFTNVIAPPGWSCSPVPPIPAGGLLTCTYAGGPVPSGALGGITIGAFVPGSGPFPPVTNCATLAPVSNSGLNETDPSNNNSCVTVVKNNPTSRQRGNQPNRPQRDSSDQTPPTIITPEYLWTGFHFGVFAGVGQTESLSTGTYPGALGPEAGNFRTGARKQTAFGGVVGGYSQQIGNIVLGLEADLGLSNLRIRKNDAFGQVSVNSDFGGSLRTKLGYAFNSSQIYVAGGLALANVDASFVRPSGLASRAGDKLLTGYTIGGGIEHAIDRQWRMRLEYRYTDFGSINAPANGNGIVARHRISDNSIRLGLSYRFGN